MAEGIPRSSLRVRERLTRTHRTAAPEVKKASPRGSNVLVVDDEEPVRKFVERVLRDAGYKTAMAGDGLEALDVAAKSTGWTSWSRT